MAVAEGVEQENLRLRESVGAHQALIEQYEQRFGALREIIEEREKDSNRKLDDLNLIIED